MDRLIFEELYQSWIDFGRAIFWIDWIIRGYSMEIIITG